MLAKILVTINPSLVFPAWRELFVFTASHRSESITEALDPS
jgi:hypothetical protein